MAKNYCVCILFNKDLTKTLLIKKAEGKLFAGMFNGLGGKLELNESAKDACIREIWEESNEKINLTDPYHLATIFFPNKNTEPITLHAFYDIIDEVDLGTNREGEAHWKPVEFLLDFNNKSLVGYGNLPYFCRLALTTIKNEW
ncbi:MAG: NUDIX domain-containing protein [Spirochaetales bacterium]